MSLREGTIDRSHNPTTNETAGNEDFTRGSFLYFTCGRHVEPEFCVPSSRHPVSGLHQHHTKIRLKYWVTPLTGEIKGEMTRRQMTSISTTAKLKLSSARKATHPSTESSNIKMKMKCNCHCSETLLGIATISDMS